MKIFHMRPALQVATAALLPVAFVLAAPAQQPETPARVAAATLTQSTRGAKAPTADGFIQRWVILEPIASTGLNQNEVRAAVRKDYFPGQFTVVPHDGERVSAGGTELAWHAEDTKNYNVNLFQFARSLGRPTSDVLFWAVTTIQAPRDLHNVRLAVGFNAASVWWLNGQEVAALYGDRQTVIDDAVSRRLDLKKGPNVLRVAVINGGGATDFCARFLDSEDRPLRDITVTADITGR